MGLTLRHDRLDNFWFCLLRELVYVGRHMGKTKHEAFLDACATSRACHETLKKTKRTSGLKTAFTCSSTGRAPLMPGKAYVGPAAAKAFPPE